MKPTLLETLAFHLLDGIGTVRFQKLLEEFGSFENIVQGSVRHLSALTWLPPKLRSGFHRGVMLKAAEEELAKVKKAGARIISFFDKDYPNRLRIIDGAPMVLYVLGAWPLEEERRSLGIVGSRAASRYGLKMAKDIARVVASKGVLVVSGLAVGIDGAAHEGALEADGMTVGVLGGGLNRFYPPENKKLAERMLKKGAVISEFPMDMEPQAEFFPVRNRIISGLSEALLVVEAREKSGALITVDFALAQGRDVYAVPGNADSSKSFGTNRLIKEGARMVTSADDVLEEMGLTPSPASKMPPKKNFELNEEEQKMLALMDEEECPIDELIEKSQVPAGQAIKTLSGLEFKGCIRQLPGQNFLKVLS